MKILKPAVAFFFFALLGCSARPVRAQVTYTSPQTVQQTLAAPGTSCTGVTQNFAVTNLGQTQHYASAVATVGVTSMLMIIVGQDNAGNSFTISDASLVPSISGGAAVISGSGYYPKILVQINCSGGTFSLNYSGTSQTPNTIAGSYLGTTIDKAVFQGLSQGSSQNSPSFIPPFGSSFGKLIFHYSTAGIAGSTIQVNCVANGVVGAYISWMFPILNNTNFQAFQVPDSECASVTVGYVSGGASINLYSTDYLFSLPGQNAVTVSAASLTAASNLAGIITERGARWDVVSVPGASSQATASRAAGALVRHVADCVSYALAASTAPAATTLQLSLRDGASGAGTVLWSKQLTAPATVGTHADNNICGLNLIGSQNTAMTLEFNALLTNESESVTLTGYDVQ